MISSLLVDHFILLTSMNCNCHMLRDICLLFCSLGIPLLAVWSGLRPCLTIVAVTQKLLGSSHIDFVRSKHPSQGFRKLLKICGRLIHWAYWSHFTGHIHWSQIS